MTLLFTKDHEWVKVEGNVATVGITDYAQNELGDIVFVELPELDKTYASGEDSAVVESVKAAGEVHNPVSGKIVEVNEALNDEPSLVNDSPEEAGWIYKIEISDSSELDALMDRSAYDDFIA